VEVCPSSCFVSSMLMEVAGVVGQPGMSSRSGIEE
jgi:hypothetical protein